MPETVFKENESVFFKLIFNTLDSIQDLGIAADYEIDSAMD